MKHYKTTFSTIWFEWRKKWRVLVASSSLIRGRGGFICNLFNQDCRSNIVRKYKIPQMFIPFLSLSRQGCTLSPLIFSLVIDWETRPSCSSDTTWTTLMMLAYSHRRWATTGLCNIARTAGLADQCHKNQVYANKCKPGSPSQCWWPGHRRVDRFTYLGSHDCELRQEEQTRILRLRFCHSETSLEE